jgi:uncharacterized protein (DUF934 family)
MALLRRRASGPRPEPRIEEDEWRAVPADAPVPPEGDVIVGLTRWSNEREALRARRGRLGVRIPNDATAAVLGELAREVALVAIEIPRLRDGRAYTLARWLRARFGFEGEVRAVGVVARDQLLLLGRAGFDAFELGGVSAESALAAFDEQSVLYQAAADEPLPLWRRVVREGPAS